MKIIPLLIFSFVLSVFVTAPKIVVAKSSTVIFVQKVSKRCKHLGSISHTLKLDALYSSSEAFKVVTAGPVFASAMKAKAKALGANRLIIVEALNDKTITSGSRVGYHESLDQSQFRARAFKC